jgi:hypothetical protein
LYLNKVMQSQYVQQYYILNPALQGEQAQKDTSMIVWVQMEEERGGSLVDEMARVFSDYGDYSVYKDSQSSFFLELFYIDPKSVPTQTVAEFITVASEKTRERGVKRVVPYAEAIKFKAHNRLEEL